MESTKPLTTIMRNLNKSVKVILKNDARYEGTMVECDGYMNMLLEHVVEYLGDSRTAGYPKVLIRGNNIMYVIFTEK
ncbi:MAG: LSM domain-containing protein [Candidatus Caldarchaeum sp.]|nr:LSM domain-containing protein [Candidatus Caldarchaeum sp.]MCS7133181.1 LSM domain-containing protein [Candidatus Caldarchaeum sp.]MCX8201752.1 LSM domain-containing protein [Candidatus Caldarchaeum sp.]MDW8062756.1 LSM domain-containing protein [Candidatus Caldarchaeum sp.]MDW8434658.1 LSM domain-containing protein [Candidatus Caldarchaeum sp.]